MPACRHDAGMRDERFDHLLSAWRTAEQALEEYSGEKGRCPDPRVRRLISLQLQNIAWRRYGRLCRYVASRRSSLPRL
jgi:hypothetical protein